MASSSTNKSDDKSYPHTLLEALALVTLLASQPRQDMLVSKFKTLSKNLALATDKTELGLTAPQERTYRDLSDRIYREVFKSPMSPLDFLHFFIPCIRL